MPLNQIKRYNNLLEIGDLSERARKTSLRIIFDRDISNNSSFTFNSKLINPTPKDGEIPMDTLFTHLTTEVVDKKTNHREFEVQRSVRLHWLKYHIDARKQEEMLVFSTEEKDGVRTYIYDKVESYVIVLEPLRKKNEYFLITAYFLRGKNKFKIENKYNKRRLENIL